MLKKMSFLSFIHNAYKSCKEQFIEATEEYRKAKNLYYLVPAMAITLAIFLPDQYTNEYFYGGATGISTMAVLYRHRWIAEFMHRKPTYIETATTFKTRTGGPRAETSDERLVHEIDHVLTRRFRNVFIHVIIFVDSVCVGILGFWAYIHTDGRDPDMWIKNIGFLGGYLMFFKQIHYYSGKFVLWLLKKRKKTAHAQEIRRRRSSSFSEKTEGKTTSSPILAALQTQQGRAIPVVKSMENFSLCGREIGTTTTPKLHVKNPAARTALEVLMAEADSLPPLKLGELSEPQPDVSWV